MITQRYINYVITALLGLMLAFVLVTKSIDPLQSPEFRALELAHVIAADVNELSAMAGTGGRVDIRKEGEFDVGIVYYNKWIFPIEQVRKAYRWIAGDVVFDREGYYVAVVPYKGRERVDKTMAAYLLSYPKERDRELEAFLEKTGTVCIRKAPDSRLARVGAC